MKIAFNIVLFATALLIQSCSHHGTAISGDVEGAEGKTIYLKRQVDNHLVLTDSAVIDDGGSFKIYPQQALEKDLYWLYIEDKFVIIITDSTECMSINTDLENFGMGGTVKGSENTAILFNYLGAIRPLNEEFKEAMMYQQQNPNDPKAREEVARLEEQFAETNRRYVNESLPHAAALIPLLSGLNPQTDKELFFRALNETKEEFGHTQHYKYLAQQLTKKEEKKQQNGRKFKYGRGTTPPDISMTDPYGNTRSLSDLRGKVVLIDFWASWCGPCRRENPNVIRAYEKYRTQGFEVFSVSLDKDKKRWMDAIQKDRLVWDNHVSDLKGWQTAVAKEYGVQSIPHTILLDQEGVVIATNLRGSLLDDELEMIFEQ